MLTLHITTNTLPDNAATLLHTLAQRRIEIGLPETAPARLRFILAIQEHGSPVMRIPPRPVVAPALASEETRSAMADAARKAVRSALAGDGAGALAALGEAGQAGADGIRRYIDAGVPPPNSPVTIHGGWIYNRVAKTGVPVGGKGFNKPLYDTGALYRAFSYKVK